MPRKPLKASDLLDSAAVPNNSVRAAESFLQYKLAKHQQRTAAKLYNLYAAALADIQKTGYESAAALDVSQLDTSPASQQWRSAFIQAVVVRLGRLSYECSAVLLKAALSGFVGMYYGKAWLLSSTLPLEFSVRWARLDLQAIADGVSRLGQEDALDDWIWAFVRGEWKDQTDDALAPLVAKIRTMSQSAVFDNLGLPQFMGRISSVMGVTTRPVTKYGANVGNGNYARVQALARTLISQHAHNGAIKLYRQNAEIVVGYTWLTTRLENVCKICRKLNGVHFKLKASKRPPAHFRCACTIIPDLAERPRLEFVDQPKLEGFGQWAETRQIKGDLDDFLGD